MELSDTKIRELIHALARDTRTDNIIAAEGFRPMKENGIISTDQIMQRGEKRQILFFHIKGKKSYFLKRIKAVGFQNQQNPKC